MPRASVLFGPFRSIVLSASYGKEIRRSIRLHLAGHKRLLLPGGKRLRTWNAVERRMGLPGPIQQGGDVSDPGQADPIFSESAEKYLGGASTRTGLVGTLRATGSFFQSLDELDRCALEVRRHRGCSCPMCPTLCFAPTLHLHRTFPTRFSERSRVRPLARAFPMSDTDPFPMANEAMLYSWWMPPLPSAGVPLIWNLAQQISQTVG